MDIGRLRRRQAALMIHAKIRAPGQAQGMKVLAARQPDDGGIWLGQGAVALQRINTGV